MDAVNNAQSFLGKLVGKMLQKAFRLDETELFCFCFGESAGQTITPEGEPWTVYEYALHIQCAFDVAGQDTTGSGTTVDGDATTESFRTAIDPMIGNRVERILLQKNQDLILFLGEKLLVIHPDDTREEAWRFFAPGKEAPHLVASCDWIEFQ